MNSINHTARLAGFFWAVTFLTGSFAMFSYATVVVRGDIAATAANILELESFYRAGVVSNLVATVAYLAATVLVYYLLKPVSGKVSLLAAFFSLAGCALSALSFVFQLGPLVVLRSPANITVFTIEQLEVLSRISLRLSEQASQITFLFFGLHCLLIGGLILGSSFMHRAVGILMACGGLGWLTFALANLLSPSVAGTLSPYILLPGMAGEASLTLWLLVKGVNVPRWLEQASA